MANISVTYTFSNSTTADATQVNQNFTDIVNGTSDGTKDFSISALTCAGTATLNGNVNLGNSSSDDLTITASLAGTVAIKTQRSYDLGSSTIGMQVIYLGGNSTYTVGLQAPSSGMSASYSFTLPSSGGTAKQYLETNGSGTASWKTIDRTSTDMTNISLATSAAANALTITLTGYNGTAFSSTNYATVLFRNTTAATGQPTEVAITSDLTLTISSGSTLGHIDGQTQNIYVYLINNSGTAELAASAMYFDEGEDVTTSAEGGGGAADSNRTLYSTTARSSVPCRFVGIIEISQTTAGTWVNTASRISLRPTDMNMIYAEYTRGSTQSMTNNAATVIDFTTKVSDSHNCVTTGTWVFTCPRAGLYRVDANAQIAFVAGWAISEELYLLVEKNGSSYRRLGGRQFDAAVTNFGSCGGGTIVPCAAGDTLRISFYHNNGSNQNLDGTAAANWVSIYFLGTIRD